jgi:hypothetical protein
MSMYPGYSGANRVKYPMHTKIEDMCVIGSLGFVRLKDVLVVRLIQNNIVKNRKIETSIKRPRKKR